MITTVVQFQLPSPVSLAEATRRFEVQCAEVSESRWAHSQILHSLRGRPCCRRHLSVGVASAAAERVYNAEWRERVEKLYGAKPAITWFDTPVIVDNQAGGSITKAA